VCVQLARPQRQERAALSTKRVEGALPGPRAGNALTVSRPSRVDDLLEHLERDGFAARRKDLTTAFGGNAIAGVIRDGRVVELLPGILATAQQAASFRTRALASESWLPRSAAVSGLAALFLAGLSEITPASITVVVPNHRGLRSPVWMRVVRSDAVRAMSYFDGVRCTVPERAVIDAWCEVPERDRVSVVLEAMRRSKLKGVTVKRTLARMPRVKDRRGLIRLLDEASEGIQSYLESRAKRTVLNTADFRGLQRQVEFVAMGKTYVVDTYDPVTRTVIEFDGAKVHGTYAAKKRDNARDAALLTLGIATVRIGYDDVMKRPQHCREVIRRTLAARPVRPFSGL
jgi:very-short-patch-repair endonuclease